MDCGFLRLPARADLEVLPLDRDELLAVLPEGHPLASRASVSAAELCEEPFMLLEKGDSTAVSEVFERDGLVPRAHFTTWDDYAIMAMVESGLGVSVLPELILRRAPYRIVAKPLDEPVFRTIGLVLRSREAASLATQRFLEYLDCR